MADISAYNEPNSIRLDLDLLFDVIYSASLRDELDL